MLMLHEVCGVRLHTRWHYRAMYMCTPHCTSEQTHAVAHTAEPPLPSSLLVMCCDLAAREWQSPWRCVAL